MKPCGNCGTETLNPKYCSSKCSVTANNKSRPTRWKCKRCGNVGNRKSKYAKLCNNCNTTEYITESSTLEDVVRISNERGKERQNIYNVVRFQARYKLKKLGLTSCKLCGYNKHVEACHIKSITSFNISDTIGKINSLENLVALCPNCHWELDHKIISL